MLGCRCGKTAEVTACGGWTRVTFPKSSAIPPQDYCEKCSPRLDGFSAEAVPFASKTLITELLAQPPKRTLDEVIERTTYWHGAIVRDQDEVLDLMIDLARHLKQATSKPTAKRSAA